MCIRDSTDTADTGSDDLCSIVAGIPDGEGYILDVVMTDEPMEKTEPQTAEQLYSYHVETARIESNNGGRGFARNVERLLWELYQTRSVNIEWFLSLIHISILGEAHQVDVGVIVAQAEAEDATNRNPKEDAR